MVTVQIIESGEYLDIFDEEITYNKQVSDLADVTTANASYSQGFHAPKTPKNTNLLENLGIVGDTSTIPYRRVYARIIDNGVAIVDHGLLTVKETTDEYKIYVQAGIIDFYRDVANDTIGETLDLTEIEHENDLSTIVNSFTADLPYKYVLADFNGPPLPNINNITNLNPVGLVPAVNLKWLWDKIFEHYGWTYSAENDMSELEDQWMSYPSALVYEESQEQSIFTARRGITPQDTPLQSEFQILSDNGYNIGQGWQVKWVYHPDFPPNTAYGALIGDGRYYEVKEAGLYRVKWKVRGVACYSTSCSAGDYKHEFPSRMAIGSDVNRTVMGTSFATDYVYVDTPLQVGDRVSIVGYGDAWRTRIWPDSAFEITKIGSQNVDFNKALIKFKVKDFFKEVMIRLSLTAFSDTEHKTIHFKTLAQRLDADHIDWSNKYVRRVSEEYTYNNYAQNNYLQHKYDDPDGSYVDGNLRVVNQNLDTEKILYQSQTYAPQEELTTWNGTRVADMMEYAVPVFKLFELELKEDADGNLIGNYKPLKDRIFIFRAVHRYDAIYVLGTLIPTVQGFPFAQTNGMFFKDIVADKYGRISDLLSDTRIHRIELNLSKYDVATLDLEKRYFFEQEAAYYLLNKLTWKNDQTTVGEFIRVK